MKIPKPFLELIDSKLRKMELLEAVYDYLDHVMLWASGSYSRVNLTVLWNTYVARYGDDFRAELKGLENIRWKH